MWTFPDLKPLHHTHDQSRRINVQQQMAHLLNAYAKAFNIWYNRKDGLFQYRFRRKPVTSDAYFSRLVYYIHFNPQHHGLLPDFTDWPYSSYHSHLSKAQTNLHRAEVLEWFGGPQAYQHCHMKLQPDINSLKLFIDEDEL